MIGPPGAGKTMLTRRLPGILPLLSRDEALEVLAIHGVAGLLGPNLHAERPFRAPDHTVSDIALVGGGEVAHRTGMVAHAILRSMGLDREDAGEVLREMRGVTASGGGAARLAWARRALQHDP
jgi:hypothetical protein